MKKKTIKFFKGNFSLNLIFAFSISLIILLFIYLQYKYSSYDKTVLFSWNYISQYLPLKQIIYIFPVILIIALLLNKIKNIKFIWIPPVLACLLSIILWKIPQVNPDTAGYYRYIIQFLDNGFIYTMKNFFFSYKAHQPFLTLFWGILIKIFGEHLIILNIVQTLFYGLITLFIILLGKELRNLKTGIIASLLFISISNILTQSALILTDIPLTAFVLIAHYCIIKSIKNKNLFWYILSIILILITVFTKITGFLFLIAPFLYLIANKKRNLNLKNMKKYFLIPVIISIPLLIILHSSRQHWGILAVLRYKFSNLNLAWDSIKFSFVYLFQINPIIILTALYYFISYKRNNKDEYIYFIFIIIFPVIILFLIAHRIALFRFSIPIIPFICLLSADSIIYLFKKYYKLAVYLILLTCLFITFKGIYPFCENNEANNLKQASIYLEKYDISNIGVLLHFNNSLYCPEVLVSMFDLYSKHKITLIKKEVSLINNFHSWTHDYILPERYLNNKKPDFIVLISNTVTSPEKMKYNNKMILLKKFINNSFSIMSTKYVYVYRCKK